MFTLHYSSVLLMGFPFQVEAFFRSDKFKAEIEPVPMALEVLSRMKQVYSLHIVTARQHIVEDATRAWLHRHYPNIFDDIHFGNHYSTTGKSRSKAEMCKAIGAQVLIDDSLIYATQCSLAGISVVLFGNYPWNQRLDRQISSQFHDVTLVVNAHQDNEVVITDFHEVADETHTHSSSVRQVYRVATWEMVEKAVHSLLSARTHLTTTTHLTQPSQPFGVVALQMCSTNDKEHNFQRTVALIEEAMQRQDVSLICLPENSAFMGHTALETALASEDLHSSEGYLHRLCQIAKEKRVWLSVGGFPEKSDIPSMASTSEGAIVPKYYNSHVLIDREGQIRTPVYRKIHLFDCPMGGLYESKFVARGTQAVVMDVEGWKIGLSICYDLRFPLLFDAMQSIDILLLPAAFTVPTGTAHWEVLLRARSIEKQCYVVAAAQSGQHSEHRHSFGHSMIVDPWGTVVDQLYREDEGICGAMLDKARLREVREKMLVQQHRLVVDLV